jgi:hypothetical protein
MGALFNNSEETLLLSNAINIDLSQHTVTKRLYILPTHTILNTITMEG